MAATKTRRDKSDTVGELAASFTDSSAAVLTEYRGLSVAALSTLRRSLGAGATYTIVKNTLTKLAASRAGLDDLEPLLEGPTAIAFVSGDPVEAVKGVRDFARTNPLLVIKGGVLDGRAISPDEIRRLADLESREVLLGKLAGAMIASLSQAAALLQAPLAQAARLAEALRAKNEAAEVENPPPPATEPSTGESEEPPTEQPDEPRTGPPTDQPAGEPADRPDDADGAQEDAQEDAQEIAQQTTDPEG